MAHHHHHHQSHLQQQQQQQGFCSTGVVRLVLIMVGVCLFGYLVGPPFYGRFTGNSATQVSCAPCVCDCSSETMLSIPLGLVNSSFADCGKRDPDVNEEMEKSIIDLLSEELNLQRNVTEDNMQHAKASVLEARKTSSQYQKEAEKCNTGIETCEEAREKAQEALRAERKLSALWENRARANGWKDLRRTSS